MAGVAAAVTLAEHGMRPILIESRPYIGGRTRSFIHDATGDEIDNGQHLLMGCYTATLALLEKLGTRELVRLDRTLRVEFRDRSHGRDLLEASTTLPAPLNVLAGMLRLATITPRDKRSLIRLGIAAKLARPKNEESVRDYLVRHGQSERLRELLWEPIVIATLNTRPERASADLFVEVMRRAFLARGRASQLAFAHGGLSALLAPAGRFIEDRGGRVMLGTPVAGIERDGAEYRVVLKDGGSIASSALIAALPARALHPLLRGELADVVPGIANIDYAPIVSIYLWYDRALTELPAFSALIGTNVQWMFNRRRLGSRVNTGFPGLLSCTISAAFEEAAATGDDVVAMADRELREAFPEMGGTKLLDALVIKEKHATFEATPDVAAHRPPARTRFEGFYLAGDWTDTRLPATIEGAVLSGVRAADQLKIRR
jgi:squalene-associated FAD-dependent desaturase